MFELFVNNSGRSTLFKSRFEYICVHFDVGAYVASSWIWGTRGENRGAWGTRAPPNFYQLTNFPQFLPILPILILIKFTNFYQFYQIFTQFYPNFTNFTNFNSTQIYPSSPKFTNFTKFLPNFTPLAPLTFDCLRPLSYGEHTL